MKFRKRSGGGLRKVSGIDAGRIAIRVFSCNGCGAQYRAERPTQCGSCGRLDFTKLDSVGEAARYADLRLREKAGLIAALETQVRFPLMAHGPDGRPVKVGDYVADFVYVRDGKQVIEDFKGGITDLASWKLRHMAAQGMPVDIVTSKGKS